MFVVMLVVVISVLVGVAPIGFNILSVLGSNLLPKKLKDKYQNTKFYLNKAEEYNFLLQSKKLSDKFKLGLINKKLLNKFNGFTYVDIVNNMSSDFGKLKLLLNHKVLKDIINIRISDIKITLEDPSKYELLYDILNDDEKYLLLSHISDDDFVIIKYEQIKKHLNDSKKTRIIRNLNKDENKLRLIKDINMDSEIYEILSTFKNFDMVISYVLKLNESYQIGLVAHMSEDEIKKFLDKNILVKPILKTINDESIFDRFFQMLSIEDKIDVLKYNKDSTLVMKYYRQYENYMSDKDKMDILVKILKGPDESLKKEAFELLPNCLVKKVASSNGEVKTASDIKMYKGIDAKISFGVELESSHKDSILIKTLDKFNYSWKVKGDSSIDDGVEIVSPILHYTKDDLSNLKFVCDFMENNGFVITNSCGGHIHIGFDYFKDVKELEMLYMIYTNTQDIFYDICNRKGSKERPKLKSYAKPISNNLYLAIATHKFEDKDKLNDFVNKMKKVQDDRYFDINIKNAQSKKKNTIEFRFPNGEISYDEVLLNITLIIKLCMAAKKYAYINKFDERYVPINLLLSNASKEARKDVLLKMLFEDNEELIALYNERYEANNITDVFTRKYIINF